MGCLTLLARSRRERYGVTVRWGRPFVAALSLTAALVAVGPVGAAAAPANGATFGVAPGGIRVQWNANCGIQDYWAVNVVITHQDGSKANGAGYIFDNHGGAQPSASQDMVWSVSMMPGLTTETFHAQVMLSCPNDGSNVVIAEQSVTLGGNCDPNLYSKAQHEYDTADSWTKLGDKELTDARRDLLKFAKDFAKESVKIGLEKYDLLNVLKLVVSHGPVVVVEIAAALAGLSITAEQLDLAWQDYARVTAQADTDFKQAKLLTDRADTDFANARPCLDPIEGQLNTLLADQKRTSEARRIIDKWENNGTLYRNPITHELVEEAAALKQAEAQLAAAPAKRPLAKTAAKSVKANAAQLRAAIKYLNTAQRHDRTTRADLARVTAADATALTRLKALLAP